MVAALVPSASFAVEPVDPQPVQEGQNQPADTPAPDPQDTPAADGQPQHDAATPPVGGQPQGDQPADGSAPDPGAQPEDDSQPSAPAPDSAPVPANGSSSDVTVRDLSAPTPVQHDFGEGYGVLSAIPIASGEELAKIGADAAYPLDANYFLADSVPDSGIELPAGFRPIGVPTDQAYPATFTGKFDGNNKTLRFNLNVTEDLSQARDHNQPKWHYVLATLFYHLSSGSVVQNLTLTGSMTSAENAYGLAETNDGVVRSVHLKGCVVTGNMDESHFDSNNNGHDAVGLVKYNYGRVENCTTDEASVIAASTSVGLVGEGTGTIDGCVNRAAVGNDTGHRCAGIVEYVSGNGSLTNCENYGRIAASDDSAGEMAGIAIGVHDTVRVENCTNYGEVWFPDADQPDNDNRVVGVVGRMEDAATMVNCVNKGTVTAKAAGRTAGVVGEMEGKNTVTNCVNYGAVSGQHRVGGIVGEVGAEFSVDCYVTDCTNYGKVTGSAKQVGGVIGLNNCGAKNLINHGEVTGDEEVGGVIGLNSKFGNAGYVFNYGCVLGNSMVGGVVGRTTASQVNFKVNIGLDHAFAVAGNYGEVKGDINDDIPGGDDGDVVGGVVGRAEGHLVELVFNEGTVTGDDRVGGVVGEAEVAVSSCYNTGDVTGNNGAGGLVGDSSGLMATNAVSFSYSTGRVLGWGGDEQNLGALVGIRNDSSSISWMHDLYYNTDFTGDLPPFGSHKVSQAYDRNIEGRTTVTMVGDELAEELGSEWTSWSFKAEAEPTDQERTYRFLYPMITEFTQLSEPYKVNYPSILMHDFGIPERDEVCYKLFENLTTADDLKRVENNSQGCYVLANDISMQGAPLPWLGGEGEFSGMLDGLDNTITDIDSEHGLIKTLNGRVMRLKLDGSIRSSAASTGDVGAFAHLVLNGGTLYRCTNLVDITLDGGPDAAVGGIAAVVDGMNASVIWCMNNATVDGGSSAYTGGIVGRAMGNVNTTIDNCANQTDGVVAGSRTVGGIVGVSYVPQSSEDTTKQGIFCINYGTVRGDTDTGNAANVGGIAGELYGFVQYSENRGTVTNGGQCTGGIAGLAGENAIVDNCSSYGTVSGSWKAGGLVGCVPQGQGRMEIRESSHRGSVTGKDYVGGLLGSVDKGSSECRIQNCFTSAASTVTGHIRVGGLVGTVMGSASLASCMVQADVALSAETMSDGGGYTAGGLVGLADCWHLDVSNCSFVGDIRCTGAQNKTQTFNAGGLVGYAQNDINPQGVFKLQQSFFAGNFISTVPPGSQVNRAGIALVDASVKISAEFKRLYFNLFCGSPALICSDSSQVFDDAYLQANTIAGLSTANMTGDDALEAAGKMTALNKDGVWRTKPSGSAHIGDGDQNVYYTAYYPSLDLRNTDWSSEEVVEPYDQKVDVVASYVYTGFPIAYHESLYNGATYEAIGYAEKTALAARMVSTRAATPFAAPTSLNRGCPKDVGEYLVLLRFTDPGVAVGYRLEYAEMHITKAPLTVRANDANAQYMEEFSLDEVTFTAYGLLGTDDESCLDEVVWRCLNYSPSSLGDYDITLSHASDNNYEITDAGSPYGQLHNVREPIEGHYDLAYAAKGANGHEDWLIGPVTITPTNGYDLIKTDQDWEKALVVELDKDTANHKVSFTLKNSQTGATSDSGSVTFNYGKPLAYTYTPSGTQMPELVPELVWGNTIELMQEGGGVFLVYVNGELSYTIDPIEDAQKEEQDRLLKVGSSDIDFLIAPLLPNAEIDILTQGVGPVCSTAGAVSEPLGPGRAHFRTMGYSVKLDVSNLDVTYDGTQHAATVIPSLCEGVETAPPTCTVTYAGSSGTVYEESETPPVNAGSYHVNTRVNVEENPDLEPSTHVYYQTIRKAPLALTAENKTRLVGEENPELTYAAEGLVNGEKTDVLDAVELACAADATSGVGAYPIEFTAATDNNYEIATTPGTLTVKQDSADGRFTVSGQKGDGGHDEWYVGEVTVAPDGRDGYDLVSDDGGATWHSSLSYTSDDAPRTVDLALMVKKSATGAYTSAAQTSFNLFTKPLTVTSLSPAHGEQYHDPANTVLTLSFDQPIEKGRGYFTITDANKTEFAKLNVGALRVRVSDDGKTVKLRLPDAFEPYGTYTVTCGPGTLFTQTYGKPFNGLAEGDWTFSVSGSSDTVSISDLLLDVEGESSPRSAVYVGRDEADYAAALVPGEGGATALTLTPQVGGVLADDRVKLEALEVAMLDGGAAPADAVQIEGTRLVIAPGVKSARIKVTAYGQTASDSATIMLMCTGWATAVVDNQTGFAVETSNLLAAINPFDLPLLEDNQVARVTLAIAPLADGEVAEAERALLLQAAGESVLGECFSIELSIDVFEKNGHGSLVRRVVVEVTEQPIVFSMAFPDDGLDHANECMLRVHGGAADALGVAVRADGARVFASDMFSTYAPAYDILRTITVEAPEHGTLAVDKTQAVKGETVVVAAVPDEGYELEEVRANGRAVEKGSFVMPDEDVTVSAVFAEKPEAAIPLPPASDPPSSGERREGAATPSTGDAACLPFAASAATALAAAALAAIALVQRARRTRERR